MDRCLSGSLSRWRFRRMSTGAWRSTGIQSSSYWKRLNAGLESHRADNAPPGAGFEDGEGAADRECGRNDPSPDAFAATRPDEDEDDAGDDEQDAVDQAD